MKKNILLIIISILFTTHLFSQTDTIFTEINGDTVTINHFGSERNCGSLFRMDVEFDEFQITLTEVDTGELAYCMCYFDLSVTIAGLIPGVYTVDIFGTDTMYGHYWGNTQFTIGGVQVINQNNSDCIEENENSNIELLVDGNYLTLNWNTPELNCGLEPLWFGDIKNDTFKITMTDIGWPADCLCFFNFSATFGPFLPGIYILDFWNGAYGYPTFTISEKGTNTIPVVIYQFQSTCYNITNINNHLSFPEKFTLYQNFPNPFNPSTLISYDLYKPCNVKLVIYNIKGQHIKTLISEYQHPGLYRVNWNSEDINGNKSPSGVYFYNLKAGQIVQQKRMLLIR